jgi:hypothetical protein
MRTKDRPGTRRSKSDVLRLRSGCARSVRVTVPVRHAVRRSVFSEGIRLDAVDMGAAVREASARRVRERQLVLAGACLAAAAVRQRMAPRDWSDSRIGDAVHRTDDWALPGLFADLGIAAGETADGKYLDVLIDHVRLDARITEAVGGVLAAFERVETAHAFTAAEKAACLETLDRVIAEAASLRRPASPPPPRNPSGAERNGKSQAAKG